MNPMKLDNTKLLGFRLQDTAGAETTGLKKGDKGVIITLSPDLQSEGQA